MQKVLFCVLNLLFILISQNAQTKNQTCQPKVKLYVYVQNGKGEFKTSGDFYEQLKKDIAEVLGKFVQAKDMIETVAFLSDTLFVPDDRDPFFWQDKEIPVKALASITDFWSLKEIRNQFCRGFVIYYGRGAYYHLLGETRSEVMADTALDDKYFAKHRTMETAVVRFWKIGAAGNEPCFFIFTKESGAWKLKGYLCHNVADWWGQGNLEGD